MPIINSPAGAKTVRVAACIFTRVVGGELGCRDTNIPGTCKRGICHAALLTFFEFAHMVGTCYSLLPFLEFAPMVHASSLTTVQIPRHLANAFASRFCLVHRALAMALAKH